MKYLCLDIGNVICKVDFNSFKNKISRTLNIELDAVDYFLNRTQRLHDLGLTNLSDELRDHFQIKAKPIVDELMGEWNKTVSMDSFMFRFLQSMLSENNVKIALLSNIGVEHTSIVQELLTPGIFDRCVKFFSCEVGARKPSLLYYKTFLDLYPEFNGAIYLDDRQENVDTGLKFDLKAIKFDLDSFSTDLAKAKAISNIEQVILA